MKDGLCFAFKFNLRVENVNIFQNILFSLKKCVSVWRSVMNVTESFVNSNQLAVLIERHLIKGQLDRDLLKVEDE